MAGVPDKFLTLSCLLSGLHPRQISNNLKPNVHWIVNAVILMSPTGANAGHNSGLLIFCRA